ncbi:hypothetical protein G9A89_001554 [Geosiphon pyriformis]|nr:hypothetical protein G9A89_001554 [Geosiphon pyriformis]
MDNLLNLENIKNTVTKETSYADLDNSVVNSIKNNIMSRKTRIHTYVLSQPPKPPSFDILSGNENMVALPPPKFKSLNQLLSIKSRVLEKRNFEPVKSFILDIELSAVLGKTISNKLICVKKNFYHVDGFGGASTLLKFPGIIRLSFTLESSLKKAKKLAVSEKILVNDEIRKVNSHSDREVIIKEIPVDFLKLAVKSVFSKFGKIVSIKMQLIGLWQKALVEYELSKVASSVTSKWLVFIRKDSVRVVLAIEDKQSWIFRDQHRTLLYTLSVGTTAYNLSSLLESYGGKTCFIGYNLSFYCVHWVGILVLMVPIVYPVSFGRKTWAQVASSSPFHVVLSDFFGTGLFSGAKPGLLVSDSLELVPLVSDSHVPPLVVFASVVSNLDSEMALDDTLVSSFSSLIVVVVESVADLSLSSSKVLTTKTELFVLWFGIVYFSFFPMSNFVWKFVMCNVRSINIPAKQEDIIYWHRDSGNLVLIITETKLRSSCKLWIKDKFDGVKVFLSGLDKGFFGVGIAIIMNNSLACHVCKVSKVPGWLLSVKLLFKNKLSVLILGLYTGTSLAVHISQANDVNSVIAKTVNEFSFVVLGGDFNENSFQRNVILANAEMFSNKFTVTVKFSDLDAMWNVLYRIVVFSANEIFSKKWFKNFDSVFTKVSSKFYSVKASVSQNLINSDANSSRVYSALSGIRKSYRVSKLAESLATKEANIRTAINKRIESFEMNKDHTIRNVLECSFHKVIVDHLVVEDKLILESNSVKSKVDVIMED